MAAVDVGAREIGAAIRRERKSYNLTQVQFAELVGISDRTLRDIEKGTGSPSLANVLTVLNALGLRIEVLR